MIMRSFEIVDRRWVGRFLELKLYPRVEYLLGWLFG